ncbi:MAG: HupE/UreJ family protein [Polyangiaceae bacterium]
MRALLVLAAIAIALVFPRNASAHGTRSATVRVVEAAPGRAVVRVRTLDESDRVTAAFDPPCRAEEGVAGEGPDPTDPTAADAVSFACDGPIAGRALVVSGLDPLVPEAIVAVSFADGRSLSAVVHADDPRAELPAAPSFVSVARDYVRLGVVHIAGGADHLIFLFLLVLALRSPRKVILAETAFTASHSLSFSATALGLVRVSSAAAEACIAVSLVLLALDVGRRSERPTAREGALTALLFGLVHGLGFAGGLREIGVPESQVGAALAGFAAGVEVGQLAFLAVVLALATRLSKRRWFAAWESRTAVLCGGVALFWFAGRALACVAPGLGG